MKKIIHITYENVYKNGILVAMVLKPAILIAEKFKINIIITSAVKEGEDNEIYHINKKKLTSKYVNVIEFKKTIGKNQSLFSFFSDIFSQIKFLSKNINSNDLIHARGYGGAFIASILKIINCNKWIFDIRGTLPEETVDVGKIKRLSLKYFLLKISELFFLRFSNHIIAVSKKMKLHFQKYTSNEITVIRNPTTLNNYPKRLKRNKIIKKIVYLGSFQNWHLPEQTFKIIKDISEILNNSVEIMVLTSDIEKANFFIENADMNCDVTIKTLSYDEIPSELVKNDLAFCLIKPTFSKSVCMPVKFNEYLAAGLFIITNRNIGDLEEIINKNSGLILDDINSSKNAKLIINNYNSIIDMSTAPKDLFWDKDALNILLELYNFK